MNWQHLMYFKSVAELQNYSKAADELYITSSALSKAIHNLEAELGFPLFEKQGRGSRLTEYGKIFYDYVCVASCSIEDGIQKVYDQACVMKGRISIGGIYTMCADYLPKQIKVFREEYPDVSFSIEYHITNQILEDLLMGNIDLGFCGNYEENASQYNDLERELLCSEELVIIMPESDSRSKKDFISFSTLKNDSFIVHRNCNSGTGPIFWDMCSKFGFTPNVAFEVPDDQSILGLVRAGLGIALIADSPSLKIPHIAMVRLEGDSPIRRQYIVWNKKRSLAPPAKAFRDFILKEREQDNE